jgi:adenylate cyclase
LSNTQLRLVVLYADVSGSTRLYEKFGDTIACADIHTCIDLLTEVVERFEGKEIMKSCVHFIDRTRL